MDEASLRKILEEVANGDLLADEAVRTLKRLPYSDLGFARVDHHRDLRQGLPEAVYGPGKTPEQCASIVADLLDGGGESPIVLTRATPLQIRAAELAVGEGIRTDGTVAWRSRPMGDQVVAVITAGTADLAVADECAAVLRAHGVQVTQVNDVGVAGLHRLTSSIDSWIDAEAVVVVAGMEGALASVVGGLTGVPVVAVPTSTGYGSALEGVTALLAMMSSCAAGLAVVGIDNGFGAANVVLRFLASASSPAMEAI